MSFLRKFEPPVISFQLLITVPNMFSYFPHALFDTSTVVVPDGNKRLFPVVFNLASRAKISSNATCGDTGPERYCRLVEHVQRRHPYDQRDRLHCDVCDSHSRSPDDAHPVTNAVDGSNSWWQSPTITKGQMYNWVTITLDLRQVGSSRVETPSASWGIMSNTRVDFVSKSGQLIPCSVL